MGALAFVLLVFVYYRVMSFAFRKRGIPRHLVVPALVAIPIGGLVNIPRWRHGSATLAVNVGGAIIPVLISVYLLRKAPLLKTALVIAAVATVSSLLTKVNANGSIVLHYGFLILPLVALIPALILARSNSPQVAFVGGTIGGLIGVDLVHLNESMHVSNGWVIVGGRGVLDGILTTGIIAALLTGLLWRKKEVAGQEAE